MLIRNATFLMLVPSIVERVNVRVEDGEIVARGKNLRPEKGEEVVDLAGRFILPGMVNAHTHLYSALARGMSAAKQSPRNFLEILKNIWWQLDKSLDEESIYYSALVGSIDALRCGTTTLVDHHASPNCINNSLDIVKEAMSTVGVRGILCYETTDRGGRKRRDAGLQENERFVTENANNQNFRGSIGAHASFTLNDDSLSALGELAAMYDAGVHIHVAEAASDVADAAKRLMITHDVSRGKDKHPNHRSTASAVSGVLARRLDSFGLLTHKSILAHGVHLTQPEVRRIENSGAWLVHNPRSNMNNGVGYAPVQWFGERTALGTDGFAADMFEESKIGYFRNQESEHKAAFDRIPRILQAGQKLVSDFFGCDFGTLQVGSAADLLVLDYTPPTPLLGRNLLGHFLFGMSSRMVQSVMVNGQWRILNRELVGVDEEKVMNEAVKIARRLWKRMNRE